MDVSINQMKAIVLGGTGLIGGELIQQLINENNYAEIHIIGRRPTDHKSSKIFFHQVNMNEISNYADLFNVDSVFCCLGTTIKTAGSQEAFRQVDYEMVVNSAKAVEGKAKQFLMVSSVGANSKSGNFYLRTKGETEDAIMQLNIPNVTIVRPSMLFGNRKEKRIGEKIGIVFMKMFEPVMLGGLKKYRGIEASKVAGAMIKLSLDVNSGKRIYESQHLEAMSN
jgi:uncharacterized protein YbjT (DUF2867 family)